MSTAPDPKHPNLPGLIFGCPPSKHRRSSMKRLLERYNVKLRGNERKEDILQKLVELENSIGEREKEALMKWFAGDNTYRSLAGLLGDAMKVYGHFCDVVFKEFRSASEIYFPCLIVVKGLDN